MLVEGGSRVITSLLAQSLVDRLIVSVAPVILGSGTQAIGGLGIEQISEGILLSSRRAHVVGKDLVLACAVRGRDGANL